MSLRTLGIIRGLVIMTIFILLGWGIMEKEQHRTEPVYEVM